MTWVQDLRFAVRMVRKQPWFSFAIVITLALGIGANTTVFSLVNAVLFKPLPFPGGDRLVILGGADRNRARNFMPLSLSDFQDIKKQSNSFEALEAYSGEPAAISEKGAPPERYRGAVVSAGLFSMIHVQPVLGSAFTAEDEKPGAPKKVLISHGVWKDRYGSDRSVIGRPIRWNEKLATIVGVMPEGFRFPQQEDAWMALAPDGEWTKRTFRRLMPVGMLKPDSSLAATRAELDVITQRIQQAYPDSNKNVSFGVRTFHETFNGGNIRQIFLLLLGAVGFVLLIACANVANMMLSRATTREREMSIRSALGAGRGRIVQQVLIESVLLAIAGGVLGLVFAQWGISAFAAAVSNVGKPYWIDFRLNYVVFGYFGAICLVSGILFGLAPALHVSRRAVAESLKDGSRSFGSRRTGRISGALVVFQFSLAMVLLAGAGLLIRSFLNHQSNSMGLAVQNILHGRYELPSARYKTPDDRRRFVDQLLPRLRSIPGVQSVAFTSAMPGDGGSGWPLDIEGRQVSEGSGESAKRPAATGLVVTPGYFQTIGISLLLGRDFLESDGLPGKEATIISKKMASRFWPSGDALGKRIRIQRQNQPAGPWMTVVGISPDIVQDFQQTDPDPLVFATFRQEAYSGMGIVLHSGAANASSLGPSLRSEVQQLDQDLPLFGVGLLDEFLQRQRWHWRVFGTLFSLFALIAAIMSAVGIYAVIAHAAARRTREIGVRIALGAASRDVLGLVMRRGITQLAIALVIGVAAAYGVTRLMQNLLFGVSAGDPITFSIVAVFLGSAGLLACWLPARRATRLDPLKALREE